MSDRELIEELRSTTALDAVEHPVRVVSLLEMATNRIAALADEVARLRAELAEATDQPAFVVGMVTGRDLRLMNEEDPDE